MAPHYRAPVADALRVVDLGDIVAIFHRRSGMTHLVASPAPEILAMLSGEGMTLDALADALAADYDMGADREALAARVNELVEAGLVEVGLVGAR